MKQLKWTIAASKRLTKCDTLWVAVDGVRLRYLVTDGTHPAVLECGDWSLYELDVERAKTEGVRLSDHKDNFGYPFKFPRRGSSGPVGMTGLMFRCVTERIGEDMYNPDFRFPLLLGAWRYESKIDCLPRLDDIKLKSEPNESTRSHRQHTHS